MPSLLAIFQGVEPGGRCASPMVAVGYDRGNAPFAWIHEPTNQETGAVETQKCSEKLALERYESAPNSLL